MTPGNALFIGIFVVMPVLIAVWCLLTLHHLRQRPRYRSIASQQTAELPLIAPPPVDAAPVTRPHAVRQRAARRYRPPAYQGRPNRPARHSRTSPARRRSTALAGQARRRPD